jgi:hypothetical protein
MGPVMGIFSSHSRQIIYLNVPFNGLAYVQLQIILLHSQEHEGNDVVRECVRRLLNQISTSLTRLVHVYRTEISDIYAS